MKRLLLGWLILLLFPNYLASLGYDENEWGKAFIIMVTNQSLHNATLSFPDDPSAKRTIPRGATLGKPPYENTAEELVFSYLPSAAGRDELNGSNLGVPTISNSNIARKPVLSGIGTTTIPGINENVVLTLQPMRGQGGAWLQPQNFFIPNSVSLQIYQHDKGSLAVIFSDDPKKDAQLKIEFGAENNNKINVSVNNQIIAFVNTVDYPDAALAAGKLKSFWLSFTETDLLLGLGTDVGKKCLLCTTIPNLSQITSNIGLMSFDYPIVAANVKISAPIKIDVAKDRQALAPAANKNDALPLVAKGVGSLLLSKQGAMQTFPDFDLKFIGEGIGYATASSKDSNCEVKIFANDAKNTLLTTTSFNLPTELTNLSLNISDGILSIAKVDQSFENTSLIKVIPHAFWQNCQAFTPQNIADNEIQISLGSPAVSSRDLNASLGRKIKFEGNLAITKIFEYEFSQEGPAIICTDKVNHQSFVLGKAAQQKAYYSFQVIISSEGVVDIAWYSNPINPTKMLLKAAVGVSSVIGTTLAMKAWAMKEAAEKTAVTIDAQIIATEKIAAVALASGAAAAASHAMGAVVEDSFRQEKDTYVYQEKMSKQKALDASIPEQAKLNRAVVEQKLAMLKDNPLKTRSDYDFVIGEFKAIMGLVNHPYVASGSLKQVFSTKLDTLLGARENFLQDSVMQNAWRQVLPQATQGINLSLLQLLIAACNNENLANIENPQDKIYVQKIFTNLYNFSKTYYQTAVRATSTHQTIMSLPASGKAIYWTNEILPGGRGSVILKARGVGDLAILLLNAISINDASTRNLIKNESVYQITIGENQNKLLTVRTAFQAEPVQSISSNNSSNFALNQLDFNSYWLNFEQGAIRIGTGMLGENECLSWKDPYIRDADLLLGLGNAVSDTEIKDFAAGPSISEISNELLQMINYLRDKSTEEKSYLTISPGDQAFNLGIIKNCNGTIFTKLCLLDETTTFSVSLSNKQYKVLYLLRFAVQKKIDQNNAAPNDNENTNPAKEINSSATEQPTPDSNDANFTAQDQNNNPTAQIAANNAKYQVQITISKEGDKPIIIKDRTIDLADLKNPFWLEITDRVLSLSFANFWEDRLDFAVMLPEVIGYDISADLLAEDAPLKLLKPAILNPRKDINFPFLSFLSDGIIGIPKTKAQLDAEKQTKLREDLKKAIYEEAKNNPLLQDLKKEDAYNFADLLYYAALNDSYDLLLYDDLTYATDKERGWQDVLTTDVLANKDVLAKDPLADASEQKELKKPTFAENAAMARMQAQGLGGEVMMGFMQLGQEGRSIWGTALDVKHLYKKSRGLYKSKEEEEAGARAGDGQTRSEWRQAKEKAHEDAESFRKGMKKLNDFIHDRATNTNPQFQLFLQQEKERLQQERDAKAAKKANQKAANVAAAKEKASMDNTDAIRSGLAKALDHIKLAVARASTQNKDKSDVNKAAVKAAKERLEKSRKDTAAKAHRDELKKASKNYADAKGVGEKISAGGNLLKTKLSNNMLTKPIGSAIGSVGDSVGSSISQIGNAKGIVGTSAAVGKVAGQATWSTAKTVGTPALFGFFSMNSGNSDENKDSVVGADISDDQGPDTANLSPAQKMAAQYTSNTLLLQQDTSNNNAQQTGSSNSSILSQGATASATK